MQYVARLLVRAQKCCKIGHVVVELAEKNLDRHREARQGGQAWQTRCAAQSLAETHQLYICTKSKRAKKLLQMVPVGLH